MLTLLLSVARADLPPPVTQKYVRFSVVVSGLAAYPDHVVVVYPWSNSNGALTAELVQLIDGQPLGFGRRIDGAPAFYAIKKLDLEVWSATEPRDVQTLLSGAQRCSGTISPRHLASKLGSDNIVDTYTLTAITDAGCEITAGSSASSEPGCQAVGGGGLWAILMSMLGLRSRRL